MFGDDVGHGAVLGVGEDVEVVAFGAATEALEGPFPVVLVDGAVGVFLVVVEGAEVVFALEAAAGLEEGLVEGLAAGGPWGEVVSHGSAGSRRSSRVGSRSGAMSSRALGLGQ